MNFFDMGMGEILLIIIIALIIWGPDKIPHVARTIGRTVAMLRKASQDLTAQITKELEPEDDKEKLPPYRRPGHIVSQPAEPPEEEHTHQPPAADAEETDKGTPPE